jgi:hypothetical protein
VQTLGKEETYKCLLHKVEQGAVNAAGFALLLSSVFDDDSSIKHIVISALQCKERKCFRGGPWCPLRIDGSSAKKFGLAKEFIIKVTYQLTLLDHLSTAVRTSNFAPRHHLCLFLVRFSTADTKSTIIAIIVINLPFSPATPPNNTVSHMYLGKSSPRHTHLISFSSHHAGIINSVHSCVLTVGVCHT